MSVTPQFLHLRLRETGIRRGDTPEQIVEILTAQGDVLGQLPVASAGYEMVINGIGRINISVFVGSASVEAHQA